ncbi:MAG TPA: Gfo/Idh/MocA family oxidoreductase [Planctomicrobium sp.]|nr:Gfo/Idh/MocA family oxidoreductase [Planctomicrobium sp.]
MGNPVQNRRQTLQQLAAGAVALTFPSRNRPTHAADSDKKIRIAQIGVGHGHANKISVYRNSPDYDVVGIAEPEAALRSQAEKQAIYQGLPWMTVKELLAIPGLQAVLVETQVCDLLDTAQQCVDAGKHIHLDKPAGASYPKFQHVIDTARQKNLVVQLGYMYRYNPGFLLLQQFLKEGWLGEIFEVNAVMSKVLDSRGREELVEFSGGTMFELGCHLIDMTMTLLGRPETVTPILQHSSSVNDSLNDNCLAVMKWPKANATIRSSGLEVDGFRRRHFVVCGTEGTFEIRPLDNPQVTVSLSQKRGSYPAGTQTITLPRFHRYIADAADMARVIRGEKETDFPYEHDLLVQSVVLEAAGMSLS